MGAIYVYACVGIHLKAGGIAVQSFFKPSKNVCFHK